VLTERTEHLDTIQTTLDSKVPSGRPASWCGGRIRPSTVCSLLPSRAFKMEVVYRRGFAGRLFASSLARERATKPVA
jgi:hypothetical protein